MNMLWRMVEVKYQANPVLARALGRALHPAHRPRAELQHQRDARRGQLAGGPVRDHGGCGGRALRPAARRGQRGGSEDAGRDRHPRIAFPAYIKKVKAGEGRLMGFGHRVYKNYDPRARIIKQTADEVFEVTGRNPQAGHRPGAGANRAGRRLLRQAQAVSQRGLLFRDHLPGHGLHARDVYRAVCHSAHGGLAGPVAGNAARIRSRRSRVRARSTLGERRREFVPMEERGVEQKAGAAR